MGQVITYDQNGILAGNGTNAYVHDATNRLITATVGPTTWTYTYGPLDRRLSKTDGTTTTRFLYDNVRAVAEYNNSGTLLRKFIYGPGLDEPILMVVPGEPNEIVYYYHADRLGSVIGLTNGAGGWMEKYAYTLYGKPAMSSSIGNPYMYTGRRFDAETGLYYYRARYYDTHLRRFIQPDPIGYLGGLNLYAYVQNNPVNWIFSYGLSAMQIVAPFAILVSQLDSPIPGPADLVAGAMIGVAILIDTMPEGTPADINNNIQRDRCRPDPNAQGDHTTIQGDWGNVKKYSTFEKDPNNPNGWGNPTRFDKYGKGHYNKATGQTVTTPHIHDKNVPGGVRPAKSSEIPK